MPPRPNPKPTGELALIERIRSRAATRSSQLIQGIGDDCAILRPRAGEDLVVTTDFSLEGRHFRRDWHPAASFGHRTLARGLSDIAAMGARPLAAFLSLAIPRDVASDTKWIDGFLSGLLALASQHSTSLAGGDTSESPTPHVLADITVLGAAPRGKALRRSTASPGDLLYVTGALGGASAEFHQLQANPRKFRSATSQKDPQKDHPRLYPHLYPQPRLAVGQALLQRKLATACIDISDGLSTDLNHLCTASGVAAELDIAELPAHPLTTALSDAEQIAAILHGGEDYELLFTAAPAAKMPSKIAGVPLTRIGRILPASAKQPTMTILAEGTRFTLQPQGWEHLK